MAILRKRPRKTTPPTGVSVYPNAGKTKAERDSILADYNIRNNHMPHTTVNDTILWNDKAMNPAGKKKGHAAIDREAKAAGHAAAEKVRKSSAKSTPRVSTGRRTSYAKPAQNQYKCGGKLTSKKKK